MIMMVDRIAELSRERRQQELEALVAVCRAGNERDGVMITRALCMIVQTLWDLDLSVSMK